MTTALAPDLDTARGVLAAARDRRSVADAAEADLLSLAVDWAHLHPAESIDDAACFGDTPVAVAGAGAPLVAEFSIHEFAAAIGLPSEVGRAYVGEAVELCHRLPRVWSRTQAGDLPAWRARRIARATISLSREAARFVDQQIAPVAHRIRPSAVDRLIDTAIGRFMPAEAVIKAQAAADGRRFDIDPRTHELDGVAQVYGTLDLADALDLDRAITDTAAALKDLGSTDSLDVRRSIAAGELARQQLSLDLTTDRTVVLHVHLTPGDPVAELANTRSLVTLNQVRSWCHDGATVIVKPIVDLNRTLQAPGYAIPTRIREHVTLRDRTCVFPRCTRPSEGCDLDHAIAYRPGNTSTDNLAPLCRSHHRAKTHGGWTYQVLAPGTYLWRSPHGYTWWRDHAGTTDTKAPDLSPPRPTPRQKHHPAGPPARPGPDQRRVETQVTRR